MALAYRNAFYIALETRNLACNVLFRPFKIPTFITSKKEQNKSDRYRHTFLKFSL